MTMFEQYNQYLRPLDQQMIALKKLNKKMPDELRVHDSWFDNIGTTNHRYPQSLVYLEFYFVVKSTLEETLAFNLELIKLTQSNCCFIIDDTNCGKLSLGPNAQTYDRPGIYLIRINLVDYWFPIYGQSIDWVRDRAMILKKHLGGIEVIGAYALQYPELLQLQDGVMIPYSNLAGIQQGFMGRKTPRLWRNSNGIVCLDAWPSNERYSKYATPSVLIM